MCHLLTFAVPCAIDAIKVPRGLYIQPFENSGSGHTYDGSLNIYTITAGGCSCGMVAPESYRGTRKGQDEKLRARYRRQGWSETKIDRALKDHNKSVTKMARPDPLRQDIEHFFQELVTKFGRVEFIGHYHNGIFTEEPFSLRGVVGPSKPESFHLSQFVEDTRYVLSQQDA